MLVGAFGLKQITSSMKLRNICLQQSFMNHWGELDLTACLSLYSSSALTVPFSLINKKE